MRTQRCSNTESLCISSILNTHVSEQWNNIDLTVTSCTRPSIGNWMSRRCHSHLKLINTKRAFCIYEDNSSDIRPLGEMQLHMQPNLSTASSCPPAQKTFGFQLLHSCDNILRSQGSKCIPNLTTLSFRQSKITY